MGELVKCPYCGREVPAIEVRRRRTSNVYVNDDLNHMTSCFACYASAETDWQILWDEAHKV